MPTNNFGQTYNDGVKYIKISKFDSGGLDQTAYLQQLQSLIINYNDLGPIEYKIITSQEKNNYYTFGIEPKPQTTSSVNYETLDYNFLIYTASIPVTATNVPSGSLLRWDLIGGDNSNYFDTTSGIWSLIKTPNVNFSIRFSGSITVNAGGSVKAVLARLTGSALISISDATIATGPLTNQPFDVTFTYPTQSIPLTSGSYVFSVLRLSSGTTATINKLWVSASSTPYPPNPATSSLIIFNPELNFEYNDYNALFGNTDIPQYSAKYMDVDYSSDPITPINFDLIISGTADRAQIQDSNYASYAWSNIRYDGSRYSSVNFNKPLAIINNIFNIQALSSGQPSVQNLNGYIGDYAYNVGYNSATPCVEQNQTYMAYFEGVGGTGPELIDQTAYFIKYLIDTQGNVTKPEPNTIALNNLIDNFESGKNTVVKLISNDPLLLSNPNTKELVGKHKITHVGRIVPIVYTETGSQKQDYVTTMSFASPQVITSSISNVGALFRVKQSSSIEYGNYANPTVQWNETLYSNNWTLVSSNQAIRMDTSTENAGTRIKLKCSFGVSKETSYYVYSIQFRILKNNNTDSPLYTSEFFELYPPTSESSPQIVRFETDWFNTNTNDNFRVQCRLNTPAPGGNPAIKIIGSDDGCIDSYISVAQEFTPLDPNQGPIVTDGIDGIYSPYTEIFDYPDQNYSTILFSTGALQIYNKGLTQNAPTSSLGFSPLTIPFGSVSPGDYIRFEYNKNQVYCIVKVYIVYNFLGLGNNYLAMDVTPNIGTISGQNNNITKDHFVIYRVVNDGTYVVLDVPKETPGNSFTGIIQPEFISQELKVNYDNIIQNLTSKGLIS